MIFGNVLSYIFQGYIFWPFFVQNEKRKNLKEDFMKKGREKGGKAEKRKE